MKNNLWLLQDRWLFSTLLHSYTGKNKFCQTFVCHLLYEIGIWWIFVLLDIFCTKKRNRYILMRTSDDFLFCACTVQWTHFEAKNVNTLLKRFVVRFVSRKRDCGRFCCARKILDVESQSSTQSPLYDAVLPPVRNELKNEWNFAKFELGVWSEFGD